MFVLLLVLCQRFYYTCVAYGFWMSFCSHKIRCWYGSVIYMLSWQNTYFVFFTFIQEAWNLFISVLKLLFRLSLFHMLLLMSGSLIWQYKILLLHLYSFWGCLPLAYEWYVNLSLCWNSFEMNMWNNDFVFSWHSTCYKIEILFSLPPTLWITNLLSTVKDVLEWWVRMRGWSFS